MSSHYRWMATSVLAGVLVMPAAVAAQVDEEGRFRPGAEWPVAGGDWTNARYSTLSQLNTTTVKSLGAAWMSKRFDNGAASRATPIVKDGLMFVTAGSGVYALNAKTGEKVWAWQSGASEDATRLAETLGLVAALNAGHAFPSPAGVAVGEGLVFVGLMDGHVVALRQKTGQLVWSQQTGQEDPPKKGQAVSGPPTYARGLVFAGLANGDWGLRGRVVALDAKTGRQVWRFFVVPGPGEAGHETWPHDSDVWKLGGGGVWLVGALDADLGMVCFVTGNAVPQTGGEIRAGDNLFTACILALDIKTGKLRWHYQVVHHDLWDADIAVPPVLYEAQIAGRPRKAVGAMRADGYLFLLDRETGKPVFPVEERPVMQDARLKTAPTQPFPVGADSLVPECATWKDKVPPPFVLGCQFAPLSVDKHNVLAPGFGVRVTPMSYSPQTGYFYAHGTVSLGQRHRISDGPWFWGGGGSGVRLLGITGTGVLAAIDSRTNTIVWKREMPPALLGGSGPLTTAGGLLFRGAGHGNFEAYDAKTGERLWRFRTSPAGGRGPASTYQIDGEQYVALAVGPVVWAFKLGGTLPPFPASPRSSREGFAGGVTDTNEIETASLAQSEALTGGRRYAVNEYAFSPLQARVHVGTTMTFINNGTLVHTVAAQDGSWSTGSLNPAHEAYVTFDKPGTYTYICENHPWSIGQIMVVE